MYVKTRQGCKWKSISGEEIPHYISLLNIICIIGLAFDQKFTVVSDELSSKSPAIHVSRS